MITEKKKNVNEILQDFSKHKIYASNLQKELANFYKEPIKLEGGGLAFEMSTRGKQICECGNRLTFEKYYNEENTMRLAGANFCKHRLCPYCAWRWHLKYSKIIERTFEILGVQNFYHMVLTIPNVKFLNKEFLIELRQNATTFIKKSLKCKDYMLSFEITIDKAGCYHPHYHVIAILKDKPTRKFLQTEWARVSNCGANYAICDIKPATDNKISQELTKYVLKFEDEKINGKNLFVINNALKGLRKFATNGKIKKAEEQAKKELQAQAFEKIQELNEYESDLMFYEWLSRGYELKETYHKDKKEQSVLLKGDICLL